MATGHNGESTRAARADCGRTSAEVPFSRICEMERYGSDLVLGAILRVAFVDDVATDR